MKSSGREIRRHAWQTRTEYQEGPSHAGSCTSGIQARSVEEYASFRSRAIV